MQRSSWIAVKKATQDNKGRTQICVGSCTNLHTGPECPPRYVGEVPQTKRTNTPAIFFLKDKDSGDRIIPYNNNEYSAATQIEILAAKIAASR